MGYESQRRATYEDTKKKQKNLMEKLDELDEKNLAISKDERISFFELLADSLGGWDFNYECSLPIADITVLQIKNLGGFIRELAYQDINIDPKFIAHYGKTINQSIQIREIWHNIKFVIFGIYPAALKDDKHISKEREIVRGGKGATIDDIR